MNIFSWTILQESEGEAHALEYRGEAKLFAVAFDFHIDVELPISGYFCRNHF